MSEWLKIVHSAPDSHGKDIDATTWIRRDHIVSVGLREVNALVVNFVGNDAGTTTFRNVKSARFVNTEDDKPNNNFVSRSCGGCE